MYITLYNCVYICSISICIYIVYMSILWNKSPIDVYNICTHILYTVRYVYIYILIYVGCLSMFVPTILKFRLCKDQFLEGLGIEGTSPGRRG